MICTQCGREIEDGKEFKYDDKTVWCLDCESYIRQYYYEQEMLEHEARYVTREMAMDAGDPSLEGQLI